MATKIMSVKPNGTIRRNINAKKTPSAKQVEKRIAELYRLTGADRLQVLSSLFLTN